MHGFALWVAPRDGAVEGREQAPAEHLPAVASSITRHVSAPSEFGICFSASEPRLAATTECSMPRCAWGRFAAQADPERGHASPVEP
eukprot:8484354-Pyramimonas_sp.AAC.1